ncbi:MAG: zinc permease [Actinomycetota bacterium]|nr:zinc permease [Actinomycetota bacterium]
MGEAILFGLIASSALIVGGVIGSYFTPPKQVTGVLLAFASGALFSALAFELFSDAFELGGAWRSGLGLLAGGATFVIVNTWLDSRVADSPKEDQREKVKDAASSAVPSGAVGFALLAAVTLDGVPENLALGVSLAGDAESMTLLVAIFFSNLPESLVGAVAMREGGQTARFAIGIWAICAVVLALAVVLGRAVLSGASHHTLAFCLAFAGGAVLASLADTLMPEAFEHGKPWNSFATGAGFFVSFMLAEG